MVITRDPRTLDRSYDLVVIGGGITGVQLAREAAARGRSVLMVDKGDFGSGTSSATTKYIHGGIRYLEQYDIAVVRESLRERRILSLAAPHLIRHTPFVLPVWEWSKPGRWLLSAGAAAYDALAFDRNIGVPDDLEIGHARWRGREATLDAVPWLESADLQGSVVITDTLNIHPERLLLALLLDAVSLGAVARSHCAAVGFDLGDDPSDRAMRGVDLIDGPTGRRHRVATTRVVNAAGPWMGEVLGLVDGNLGPPVSPSKGVHVLTKPVTDGVTHAVLARAPSGRHVIVSPWQGRSFIGPTDTPVSDAPDHVTAVSDDVDEILSTVNSCRAADDQIGLDQVDDVTVGIRPLVGGDGGDTYTVSRDHEVHDHADDGVTGLWSVSGGKWTTGRAIADDVADQVLGRERSPTRKRPVWGTSGWADSPTIVFELAQTSHPDVDIDYDTREHLARLFGTGCVDLFALIADQPDLSRRISRRVGCRDVGAQVVHAVAAEGAITLADIVDRRLVLGTLGPVLPGELRRVADIAAPLLGWPERGTAQAEAEIERRDRRHQQWQPAG